MTDTLIPSISHEQLVEQFAFDYKHNQANASDAAFVEMFRAVTNAHNRDETLPLYADRDRVYAFPSPDRQLILEKERNAKGEIDDSKRWVLTDNRIDVVEDTESLESTKYFWTSKGVKVQVSSYRRAAGSTDSYEFIPGLSYPESTMKNPPDHPVAVKRTALPSASMSEVKRLYELFLLTTKPSTE